MESSHASVPRASLANFVSTSVLTSADGLFGDNVEETRVTQAPAPRAHDAVYKPLFEQLQERREQKESEWKEKNNPFAPPKGLDDDEYEYIKELESKKDAFERKRQAQHKEDLAQFRMLLCVCVSRASATKVYLPCCACLRILVVARGAPKSTVSGHLTAQQLQQHPPKGELKTTSKAQSAMVMVKAKQKAQDRKTRDPDLGAAASADKVIERPQKKKQKVEKASTSVGGEREKATTAALGLVSYDSDSDSNSSDGAAAAS